MIRFSESYLPCANCTAMSMLPWPSWFCMFVKANSIGKRNRCIWRNQLSRISGRNYCWLQIFICSENQQLFVFHNERKFFDVLSSNFPKHGARPPKKTSFRWKVDFLTRKSRVGANFWLLECFPQLPVILLKKQRVFGPPSCLLQNCEAPLRCTKFAKITNSRYESFRLFMLKRKKHGNKKISRKISAKKQHRMFWSWAVRNAIKHCWEALELQKY